MKALNGEAGESVCLEITEKPNEETGLTVNSSSSARGHLPVFIIEQL